MERRGFVSVWVLYMCGSIGPIISFSFSHASYYIIHNSLFCGSFSSWSHDNHLWLFPNFPHVMMNPLPVQYLHPSLLFTSIC